MSRSTIAVHSSSDLLHQIVMKYISRIFIMKKNIRTVHSSCYYSAMFVLLMVGNYKARTQCFQHSYDIHKMLTVSNAITWESNHEFG
jgi:hypothetical protein